MSKNPKGRSPRLGRGLANLIPETPPAAGSAGTEGAAFAGSVRQLGIDVVVRNPDQPRKNFDEQSLRSLADSIQSEGLVQPITVTPLGNGTYMIIAGERRWRAAGLAGLTEIPAYIKEADEVQKRVWGLLENLQRENLNPVEKAQAISDLVEHKLTQAKIAERLGMSRPAVANLLRLLQLEAEYQELMVTGALSEGHGRALLKLDDRALRTRLVKEIVSRSMSVRAAEARADQLGKAKPKVGKTEKAELSPALKAVRDRFQEALATRVEIRDGEHGGHIVVHFRDDEDLTRILDAVERTF